MQQFTDADLVRRVLIGERNDFAELVRRHQDGLYRHARGMGLDHDTSLDLVQDAFVKAYARLPECRDPQHFRAWLFRIGRNLCLDYLKNVRRASIPLSSLPNADQIPAEQSADVVTNGVLDQALSTLPIALREAFLLKHDAEYTYEEVAEMTSASVSAVKMRVHRAREARSKCVCIARAKRCAIIWFARAFTPPEVTFGLSRSSLLLRRSYILEET